MPIYCINVLSATQRWDRMKQRFGKANMDAIQWPAATPDTLGSLPYAHYLSPGQRGCAKSHFDLWCHMVEHTIPAALIFEDDAVLRHDFWTVLQPKLDTIQTTDPDWDMLLLNASEEVAPMNTWVVTRDQCLTAGYILSLRGATELVNIGKSTLYASDWMTQILQRRGHTYTYFPWLVIQDGIDSIIRNEPAIADWEKVKRLLNASQYGLDNYMF